MIRFFAIMLFFGLAIVSGAAGYFSNLETQQEPEEPVAPTEFEPIAAFDLIDNQPSEDKAVRLTDFFFGRLPIGINLDDNKKDWEEVYIPLFARSEQVQSHNSICVIFRTDEFKDLESAEEFFDKQELDGFYVQNAQELPDYAFSNLAQKYKSLDYRRCILITSKQPVEEKKATYQLALIGFAFFLSIAGWQSFALLGDMKTKIEREKRAKQVSDAAGLSELFQQDEPKEEKPDTSSAQTISSVESFLDDWSPDS